MRRWTIAAALAVGAVTLAGCGLAQANKDTDAIARRLYTEISQNADLSKDANVSPVFEAADSQAELAAIRAMIPAGAPTSSSGSGWHYSTSTGEASSVQTSYTYKYADRTIDVTVVLQKGPNQPNWTVVGFGANREGDPASPVIVGVPPKTEAELDSSDSGNSSSAAANDSGG